MFKKGTVIKGCLLKQLLSPHHFLDEILERIVKGKNVFVVTKCSSEKDLKYVMKVLFGGTMNDEIKIGMTVGKQCPYLVSIFDALRNDGDDDELFLIMEFCDGGDLSTRIEKNVPPTDIV
jgi:serine/threonine protein kinase